MTICTFAMETETRGGSRAAAGNDWRDLIEDSDAPLKWHVVRITMLRYLDPRGRRV